MTEVSQHSSLQRHRPTPLATPQPPVQRTQGGGIHDRAQLLSGLRTARPNPTTPMSAFAPPTNYQQQAYLQLLQQQQVLMQQSHMILQQQQQYEAELLARRRPTGPPVVVPRSEEQAERFLETRRRMQQDAAVVAAPPRFGQTLGLQEEDEESVRGNPLAASALARRKRQSLTMESLPPQTPTPTTAAQRRVSYGAPPTAAQQAQFGHRRTSSSASAQSARSDSIPTSWTPGKLSPTLTDPPALILSKPGEAYPSTSSAGSDDGDKTSFKAPPARPTLDKARRFSVDLRTGKSSTSSGHSQTSSISSTSDDGVRPIAPWLAGVTEAGATSPPAEVDAPRRPSQAGTLTAALSGRRQRPVSLGGPPTGSSHLSIDVAKGNNYGGLTTGGGASFFPNQQGQPRSVSDSSALSPFATTFQPLPVSPFTPSVAAYAAYAMGMNTPIAPTSSRQSPPAVNGTATPIRQPRGPAVEAELSSSNFATRVRKSAIGRLTVGRLSIGGAGGGL